MAPYKVLVPLDGSRLAEHSLVYLQQLRKLDELDVLLVSVVDEAEDFNDLTQTESVTRERNVLATYLREVQADFAKYVGLDIETRVMTGAPAPCIVEEARNFAPDLLIVATHGRSGVSRWRFGSVADKVIRGAGCNTLVIGPHASEREKWFEADVEPAFRTILVPLDGSELAHEALPIARELANKFGASLHLVQVVSLSVMGSDMPNVIEMLVSSAREYLQNVAEHEHIAAGVTTEVLMGSAAFALERYIEAHAIDLVVMSSHGRGGFVRSALGSVTDRLLGGHAPVLVVRPSAAAGPD